MSFVCKTFLIFIFVFSINVFGATGPEEIPELKEKVYYNVTPQRPNIGDQVQIEVEMYGTPTKDSSFIWKIEGKIFKEGMGANKADFTLTEKTKIDLKITTGANVIIEKSFEFDPKKIIIIWESRTYTPPFYKGKSLHSPESSIILNAINLDQENPLTNTNNNYVWKIDTTVKGNESGVGRSSYLFQGDILGNEPLFTVTVSSLKNAKNNTYNNEAILQVQKIPSKIITYEKSPLLGVLFNKTVKPRYFLNKSETTLVSYPMYYSLSSSLSGLYSWYLNDVKINTALNEISFKKTKEGEQSRLSVKIQNLTSILQTRDVLYIVDTSNQ